MYHDVYKYLLETILEHISICNRSFFEIKTPINFVSTDYEKTLLDSIVTRLQAIRENLKNIRRKHDLLQTNYHEYGME